METKSHNGSHYSSCGHWFLHHGGSWVRIPSGAQIFSVSSYGWFFTSPFIFLYDSIYFLKLNTLPAPSNLFEINEPSRGHSIGFTVFLSVNFGPQGAKKSYKLESVIVWFYIIRWFVLLLYLFMVLIEATKISPLELDRNSYFFFLVSGAVKLHMLVNCDQYWSLLLSGSPFASDENLASSKNSYHNSLDLWRRHISSHILLCWDCESINWKPKLLVLWHDS